VNKTVEAGEVVVRGKQRRATCLYRGSCRSTNGYPSGNIRDKFKKLWVQGRRLKSCRLPLNDIEIRTGRSIKAQRPATQNEISCPNQNLCRKEINRKSQENVPTKNQLKSQPHEELRRNWRKEKVNSRRRFYVPNVVKSFEKVNKTIALTKN